MIRLLKTPHEKTIKLILKFKNEKYKDFKYDLDSLADAFNDERFRRMDLCGWRTNDKCVKEINEDYAKAHPPQKRDKRV